MRHKEMERFLSESLDDDRLSRGERQVLKALVDELAPTEQEQHVLLHSAFGLARKKLKDPRDADLVAWLEEVVKVLRPPGGLGTRADGVSQVAEAWFLPTTRALGRLRGLIGNTRKTLDVCLFTITHDDLALELLRAHERKVQVRIVTDDEKTHDLGSDIKRLAKAGIKVRTDNSPWHMHNKFAVMDGKLVVTGSFNWTRQAAERNQESFIVSDEPALVGDHAAEFQRLWVKFGPK